MTSDMTKLLISDITRIVDISKIILKAQLGSNSIYKKRNYKV